VHSFCIFRLTVFGAGSTPVHLVLFLVAFSVLVLVNYVKNRLLTALEPELFSGIGGSTMIRKIKIYVKYVAISVTEAISALGASSLASGGPLT